MSFDEWFSDVGQRQLAFNARQWAKAGWNGHRIHGDGLVNEAEPLALPEKTE